MVDQRSTPCRRSHDDEPAPSLRAERAPDFASLRRLQASFSGSAAENPDGRIDVGRAVGSNATAMYIYDLEPGRSSCPYHYEYEEEWLLVLDGTIVLRARDGEHTLERGDLVCFSPGPGGAHKLMNRSESPARMLMFSSTRVPAVSDSLAHRRGLARDLRLGVNRPSAVCERERDVGVRVARPRRRLSGHRSSLC